MDARSLAMEMAPIIVWQRGRRPEFLRQFWSHPSRNQTKNNVDLSRDNVEFDMLAGKKAHLSLVFLYI